MIILIEMPTALSGPRVQSRSCRKGCRPSDQNTGPAARLALLIAVVLAIGMLINRVFSARPTATFNATSSGPMNADWLAALRAYLGVTAMANLAWETLHLPLYTIWSTGTIGEQTFAVLHCAAGDILIALSALLAALISVGSKTWPTTDHWPVLLVTLTIGVAYTIFSEWLNIVVRASWAYSPLMPVVPIIDTGLSPLLQWIVIPLLALGAARRAGSVQ